LADPDFSIGAIGAASIAAVISLIGLIVAKENKTSEFRQDWINALRENISDAIAAVSAFSIYSGMQLTSENAESIAELWRKVLKSLAQIELRLNVYEDDHHALQQKIRKAESLIKSISGGEDLSNQLETLQDEVVELSQTILKREWDRVRAGEATFQITKYALMSVVGFSIIKTFY
jgi:hypothetical protein